MKVLVIKQIEKHTFYLPCLTQESAEEDDDDSDDSDDDEEIDDDKEDEEAMEDSDGEQVWSSLFFLRQQFFKGSERRNRCYRWNMIIQIKNFNNSDGKNHITLHIDNNFIKYDDDDNNNRLKLLLNLHDSHEICWESVLFWLMEVGPSLLFHSKLQMILLCCWVNCLC